MADAFQWFLLTLIMVIVNLEIISCNPKNVSHWNYIKLRSKRNKMLSNLIFITHFWKNLAPWSCELYNNKCMIASTQIANTEIFPFAAALVFKLLTCKVLFINRKDNKNCLKSRLLFKKIANFTGKLLRNYK